MAWTVLCIAGAMWIGLRVGRPLHYSDGSSEIAGVELSGAGMLRWQTPTAEHELRGTLTGRVTRLPDGRLMYGVLTADGTSDLVTWHPDRPDVPPEPAYGLNSEHNELAPAFLATDGRVFFASDRPGGVGGYDLYVSTWTARGFGRIEAVTPCNTLYDETDPAPDPRDQALLFVRIDRAVADGDDGVLHRWQLGALDPAPVFPALDRRRERTIDRDPAFDVDGSSLWFVRKQVGQPLQVCRSSRLGDAFDEPVVWSQAWGTRDLRSPLPLPGGRELALVQPLRDGQPALWFVASAQELVPWWPGQQWLEWLLLSLAIGALLLLLLLYFGQRFSALDLVAQCLLLSLLLHVLLFLWLMGVEIVGALMPGEHAGDTGMEVSIVSSPSQASAAGGGGGVAAAVQFTMRERQIAVQAPATATARAAASDGTSLTIDSGTYDAEPFADDAALPQPTQLADAAAAGEVRAAADADAELVAAALAEVQPLAVAAGALAPKRLDADAQVPERTVEVAVPPSAVARGEARALSLPRGEVLGGLPVRTAAAQVAMPAAPNLADVLTQDASAEVTAADGEALHEAAVQPIAMAMAPTLARETMPAAVAVPQRAAAAHGTEDAVLAPVRAPASGLVRPATAPVAAGEARRAHEPVGPHSVALPTVVLRGDVATSEPVAAVSPAATPAVGDAPVAATLPERRSVPLPLAARPKDLEATRDAHGDEATSSRQRIELPSSALARGGAVIGVRDRPERAAPGARALALPVVLREPVAGADVGEPRPVAGAAEPSAYVPLAIASPMPSRSASAPVFAPRRQLWASQPTSGAFAERFAVEPPPTRLARAVRRPTELPRATPAVAKNAYSNRFGPAKTEALERFGGTVETERAVRDGLRYLAGIQNRDGSWGSQRAFDGKYGFVYVGKTALCVLAFLGAGHTPTSASEHSQVVARALQHLLALQDRDTGAFGRSSCYGHGITTYAVAECYGLTRDPALVRPLEDGLTWILANQGPRADVRNRGGWGYFSPGLRAEDSYARVSVTSWMVMALESARLSGVDLPEEVLPAARQYLELSFDRENGWFRYNHERNRLRSGWPTLPASTPAGAFCLMLLGAPTDDEMVRAAAEFTVARRPQHYRRYSDDDFVLRGQGNVYFWYYGSLCCFLRGGEDWQRWNRRLSTVLPAAQAADGSFPPIDVYAEEAGDTDRDRSYTTAMCVLSLEVYYRYFTPLLLGR